MTPRTLSGVVVVVVGVALIVWSGSRTQGNAVAEPEAAIKLERLAA